MVVDGFGICAGGEERGDNRCVPQGCCEVECRPQPLVLGFGVGALGEECTYSVKFSAFGGAVECGTAEVVFCFDVAGELLPTLVEIFGMDCRRVECRGAGERGDRAGRGGRGRNATGKDVTVS